MKVFTSNSVEDTQQLGRQIGGSLSVGDCVALDGDLGSGKTAFVRGLAAGMGCDERLVSSPTYVLMQEYPGPMPLYHLDLYRMGNAAAEFSDMFPEEMLEDGVMVIEWAGMAEKVLPLPRTHIKIEILSKDSRKFTITEVQ